MSNYNFLREVSNYYKCNFFFPIEPTFQKRTYLKPHDTELFVGKLCIFSRYPVLKFLEFLFKAGIARN